MATPKNVVHTLSRRPRAALARATGPVEARRLRRDGEAGALVADAVDRARNADFAADERRWLQRLAVARAELADSDEVLMTAPSVWTGNPADSTPVASPVAKLAADVTKPRHWTDLLFSLIRTFRPRTGLELGTCLGVSAAYQGAALELNDGGVLHTVELVPERAAFAASLFERQGLTTVVGHAGAFDAVLPDLLPGLPDLDYVFVDGHHDGDAVIHYLALVESFLAPGAVIVVDDIRWSDGMLSAWQAVQHDPRFALTVDFGEIGLAIAGDGPGPQRRLTFP